MTRFKAGRAAVRAATTLAFAAGFSPAALSQEAVVTSGGTPAAAAPTEGLQVLEAAYFAAFNPVTAFDMVGRVPGFEIDDGEARRGFGATAGNVLINGERPSSKTIVSDQLKRIPAASVIRVELISGSASGSDVRGQSQLVNLVVRKATAADSPTTFVLAARWIEFSERIGWTAQASRSIPIGDNAELAIDIQSPNIRGRSESVEVFTTPGGTVTEVRNAFGQPNNIGLQGTAVLKWKPTAQDNVSFNLQYAPTWNTTGNGSYDFLSSGALRRTLAGRSEYENNYKAEAGADWEHRFSDTLSMKAIGLMTMGNVDQSDRFEVFSAPATNLVRLQDRTTETGERVGRLTATWRPAEGHTIEVGGEGAYNFRDTTLDITQQVNGGAVTAVPLDVSEALVEEVRGEAFITEVWNVSKAMTLEAGFTFEASRITQSGSETNEREFTYPKPRLVGTFILPAGDQIRASIERDVSQLDFAEFASTVNFNDGSSVRGNPELEPEKAWKTRLEWERRFGKRGALTLAVFHDAIEDVRDYTLIGGQDAFGNIGDGSRTGIEARGALPLAFIGLTSAELRFNGLYQQSEVTDPWTLETRDISINFERQGTSGALNAGPKDWAYLVTYRQELPKLQSAIGVTLQQWSGWREFKNDEVVDLEREKPKLDFYYETTVIKPLTIRFLINNILSPPEDRVWTFYSANRGTGAVSRIQTRHNKGGPDGTFTWGMQVSGKF